MEIYLQLSKYMIGPYNSRSFFFCSDTSPPTTTLVFYSGTTTSMAFAAFYRPIAGTRSFPSSINAAKEEKTSFLANGCTRLCKGSGQGSVG